MARRKETVVIPGVRSEKLNERDNGKTFVITEMDAYSGQEFALRALLVLSRSGAQLPPGALGSGWDALASFAFSALLGSSHAEIKPLLDELLGLVQYQHKPGSKLAPQAVLPDASGNSPIEEIATYLTLYKAAWVLHTGFSMAASAPTTESDSSPTAPAA
jgi:hypothetical protein